MESDPLVPSMSAILEANITEDIDSGVYTVNEIKLLNSVCPGVSSKINV